MYKTNLHTILKETDKIKFDLLRKKKNPGKSELFEEAVDHFIKHFNNKIHYEIEIRPQMVNYES